MGNRLLRRVVAVVASIAVIMVMAGPAFANVAKWGSISCPSRPTYLQAKWYGYGYVIPPWHYMETIYYYGYYAGWRNTTKPGEYDGGSWYAEGSVDLDTGYTYAYCQ